MNRKKLFFLELGVLILSLVSSFLFHMLYDWTNQNALISLIAPINESVWEHGKLVFFPFLIYSVVEYFLLNPQNTKNYFAVKFFSVLIGTITMSVLFYLYSGIIGKNFLVIDVFIGLFSIWLSYYISYYLLKNKVALKKPMLIIGLGIIVTLLFFIFTFYPPQISWFIPK